MNNRPNKHLIALINFLLLIPLVYFIPNLISPFLPVNKLVQVVATVATIVPIISYIAMPITVRYLSRIEAKRRQKK
ncbi:hypothetical protein BCS89_23555 [Vibrio splendidus]|nr:hypothetical protein BCS97_24265 [Vibrio splendidus]PMP33620.1 hypothetical protein BCS89_23555 [Vibrio splendidus]PMP39749.1 hypothetical protein BCS88_23670 [Vibrio splendidus]PMP45901.1 hypothetical protein BCS87_23575 [Vibrio splendidus]PMP51488.1 hypothetical protein BCS83_19270 [Vibrio splendidus]